MENRNKLNEITRKLSEISLNINRVPPITKRNFIGLANAEFSGDYGMLLKDLVDDYFLFRGIKSSFTKSKIKITFKEEKLIIENDK